MPLPGNCCVWATPLPSRPALSGPEGSQLLVPRHLAVWPQGSRLEVDRERCYVNRDSSMEGQLPHTLLSPCLQALATEHSFCYQH